MVRSVERRAGGHSPAVVLAALVAALLTVPARGQTLEPDRPGLLYAPSVLSAGGVQLELSGPHLGWGPDEPRSLSFPSVLRVGVGHSLELQVGHTLVNRLRPPTSSAGPTESGWGDLSLALKLARPPGAGWLQWVVVGSLNLPTGSDPFTSGDPVTSVQVQAGGDVGRASVGVLVGYSRTSTTGRDPASGIVAASIGTSVGDAWSTYVEAGYFPGFSGDDDTALVGTGLTRFIGERVQLDAFLNRGLSGAEATWTFGTGVCVRF